MNRCMLVVLSLGSLSMLSQSELHAQCYDGTYQKYCSSWASVCGSPGSGNEGDFCGVNFTPHPFNTVQRCTQTGGQGLDDCQQYPYAFETYCGYARGCYVKVDDENNLRTCEVDFGYSAVDINTPDGYLPYGNTCDPSYMARSDGSSVKQIASSSSP